MRDGRRMLGGILLLALGVAGLITMFGPLQFGDRISSRVDAEGTVQWGLPVDATDPTFELEDGEYGAWKVDYWIDGTAHTGVILGSYSSGERILVAAPDDGSFYSLLHEGTPTGLKVLGWALLPLTLAAIVFGGLWLIRGLRARDARNRAEARAQLARMYPGMFPPVTTPSGGAGPATAGNSPGVAGPGAAVGPTAAESTQPGIAAARTPRATKAGPDFFAPYDL